jgi:hypothetical protein
MEVAADRRLAISEDLESFGCSRMCLVVFNVNERFLRLYSICGTGEDKVVESLDRD